MIELFTTHTHDVKHAHQAINNLKKPLTEDEVQNILDDARAQLRNACRNKLLRRNSVAESNLFFGRKASIVKAEIAQTIIDHIQNKTKNQENNFIQALSQVISTIKAIQQPYSNIVFALISLAEKLEDTILKMQPTQEEHYSQKL